jgi:hypothetical protein
LAATNQNVSPEPIDALSEGAQLIDIPGNSMVLVVAVDDFPKPCTNLTDAIMLPAEKLNLDSLQLRNHSLFRRNPPDGEGVGLVTSPAVVGEAQERKGLRFALASLFPFVGGEPPELDQPSLIRVEFQAELRQSFLELLKEPHGIGPMLEAHHKVSSPRESHPEALAELYVSLSTHTAPIMEPRRVPICQ